MHQLCYRGQILDYGQLARLVQDVAAGLQGLGLERNQRVGVYLPKQFETVAGIYGAAAAGGVFVPLNPALKARQVCYILRDCAVRVLITSPDRLAGLRERLADCPDLRAVVLTGALPEDMLPAGYTLLTWDDFVAQGGAPPVRRIESDMAAIFYTSGSTGSPKGVVLSHHNMVVGAHSVSRYLENRPEDRILAVQPLSFDYGFSQISTAFTVGACAVLMNYLFPRDVIKLLEKERITGLGCVPPLWIQLVEQDWPAAIGEHLRYVTNTGGKMPRPVLSRLRALLPQTRVYLMYGLTEAFRSTYLPPEEVDARPDSIGKAIPNAEVMVVCEDGTPCEPGEPGELVHRGPLVSLGYWNDAARTAERFKPAPGQPAGIPLPEMAVWSGDTVRQDEDGFLYFVARRDEMIKTSGFRVSPTEVEEVLYASGEVGEAVALGVADDKLGQAIIVLATAPEGRAALDEKAILAYCRKEMPSYMVPRTIMAREAMPRNPNGKIDRKALAVSLNTAEGQP